MEDETTPTPAPAQEQRENNGGKQPGGCTGKGFRPGCSGNPGGRPKGRSITAALQALLDERGPEAIAAALLADAELGNLKAIRLILDRLEGKAPDRVEHEHDGEVTIRVVYEDPLDAPEAPPGPG